MLSGGCGGAARVAAQCSAHSRCSVRQSPSQRDVMTCTPASDAGMPEVRLPGSAVLRVGLKSSLRLTERCKSREEHPACTTTTSAGCSGCCNNGVAAAAVGMVGDSSVGAVCCRLGVCPSDNASTADCRVVGVDVAAAAGLSSRCSSLDSSASVTSGLWGGGGVGSAGSVQYPTPAVVSDGSRGAHSNNHPSTHNTLISFPVIHLCSLRDKCARHL